MSHFHEGMNGGGKKVEGEPELLEFLITDQTPMVLINADNGQWIQILTYILIFNV